jgi:DNA-binding LytR/AlgR family response regulator
MSEKGCGSFKVMLVEDDDGFRSSLAGLLKSRFPSVLLVEASDGAEAMEKVESFLPQLIFMDIKLPGQNQLGPERFRISWKRCVRNGHIQGCNNGRHGFTSDSRL